VVSSDGGLSSPPNSPGQSNGNNSTPRVQGDVGVATGSPTPNSTTNTPRLTAAGTVRKKPGPKPKPKDPNAPEKKSRKPRKPAEPKDPSAEPAPRKRRTKASLEAQSLTLAVKEEPVPQLTRPPSLSPQTRPGPPGLASLLLREPLVQTAVSQAQPARPSNNPEPFHGNPNLSHVTAGPSTPRPASSGQRYDPIRGGVFESKPSTPSVPPPPISPPLNRASASPSITSLIDPPSAANSMYGQAPRLQPQTSFTSAPASPAVLSSRLSSILPHQDQTIPRQTATAHTTTNTSVIPMEIDSELPRPPASAPPGVQSKKSDSGGTGTPSHSNAATPPTKPARQKEAPPPMPTGSGLLSGSAFGPISNASNGSAEPIGTNIWITIPVNGRREVVLNFAQEVEKKYGFAALHPKIAARKERLRQVTAAGAALEKAAGGGSADDMSLDLSEAESNVEMGGMDDDGSTAGAKKRRKRKQEDYDKEDDFIDDAELAWEQQALMAKDGFFVYSGPLVTEEKPAVERFVFAFITRGYLLTFRRADGTVRRGRGRGRGGTVRGETSGRGRGRGGGPGSRGGTTVRKPRVTKADRAMMDQEKLEREKMAANLASAPKAQLSYNNTVLPTGT
jgi:hypothetical protein